MWLWRRNFEVFTNPLDKVVVDFTMSRHGRGFAGRPVDVNSMLATLTKEFAAIFLKVSNEVPTFH
jgi:hypothetical protein